jgi:hypothetical protein
MGAFLDGGEAGGFDLPGDEPVSSLATGRTLIAVPDLTGPPAQPGPLAGSELAHRFGAIWELADAGVETEAIARVTGQPIGQIDLILGLKRTLLAAENRA